MRPTTALVPLIAVSLAAFGAQAIPRTLGAERRPALFRIELQPGTTAPSASGVAELAPGRSPFGLPLTPDGHFIFGVTVTLHGLPAPSALGPYTKYDVWAVTDDLSQTQLLGTVQGDQPVRGQVTYNKFLIFVTAEGQAPAPKWKGPIILRGFAPSALLENFSGKTMFNNGMPQ